MPDLDTLEQELSLSFQDKELLRLAFVHSSYVNENPGILPESNERLEFLGDAFLDLVIAHALYQRFPERHEGELTALRSLLVRGETLARIAQAQRLGDYLLMGTGEDASGGRNRQSNLAATFEALIGAVFQDQGYEGACAFVLKILAGELTSISKRSSLKNPKSALQEFVQGKGMPAPSYRIVNIAGKDHDRVFTAEVIIGGEVKGRGTGRRKSLAEQEAALQAMVVMAEADL
jgi:ribonuclease-3